MKTSARTTPDLFAADFDPITASPESIRKLPARYFQTVSEHLEDWNCHSENVVLLALRKGTLEQIETARHILRQHHRTGFITSDLLTQRNALHTQLQKPAPPPVTLTPLQVCTLTSKLHTLEKISLAALEECNNAGNGPGSLEYEVENLTLFTIREALFILKQ